MAPPIALVALLGVTVWHKNNSQPASADMSIVESSATRITPRETGSSEKPLPDHPQHYDPPDHPTPKKSPPSLLTQKRYSICSASATTSSPAALVHTRCCVALA